MKNIVEEAPDTLEAAIAAMRDKILDLMGEFHAAPLDIETEMGNGRTVIKANPFVQEYRALVRDYTAAVNAYRDLTGKDAPAEISSLSEIRSKLKIAK